MRFSSALVRRRKSKADVEQNIKTLTGQNVTDADSNAVQDDKNNDSNVAKQKEDVSDTKSTNSSPSGSPKRKQHLEGTSNDAVPSSPKHSLSTIMSSMKKATVWSEMTSTAIKVPTVARIVWLANRGKWLALDQLLDKLFLDEAPKIDLKIESSLLGVCNKGFYYILEDAFFILLVHGKRWLVFTRRCYRSG